MVLQRLDSLKISDLTIEISGLEMILHKRSEANKRQKVVIHVT